MNLVTDSTTTSAAERKRLLVQRHCECIVNRQERTGLSGCCTNYVLIRNSQQRVRRRLQPHEVG
jgi:hypothetical protein